MLAFLINFIVNILGALGYPGLVLLMMLQSAGIPIPSEIIMPFAGFLVFQGKFSFASMLAAATVGSVVGACLGYAIGRFGGRPLIERYGRYVLISDTDLKLTERFFAKFGALAVLMGKLLPVLNTFVGLIAGIAELPFRKFFVYVMVGSLVWNAALGYAGLQLGEHWLLVRNSLQKFDLVIVLAIVAFAAWWIYRHVKHLRHGS